MDTSRFPGAELVEQGLRDLRAGVESEEALLVLIGASRLRQMGIAVPEAPAAWMTPLEDLIWEHRLYLRLAHTEPDSAHSRYNALIRTLVSFERAGECVS